MISDVDFVAFLSVDWINQHRNKYLFLSMAKARANCRILCVQRPICFFTTLLRDRKKVVSWFKKKERLNRVLPNLFIYQPVIFLNDHLAPYVPGAAELNRKALSYQVTRKIDELGLRKNNLVSWISDPVQDNCLGLINEKKSIYDCFDDYFAIPGNSIFMNKEKSMLRENRILENADIVLTVSNDLYEKKSKLNKQTYIVPNAADTELFGRAADESTEVPPRMADIPHPIIGMVGNLHQRIDFNLIGHIAVSHPEWSIVIVGDWSGADPDFVNSDLIKKLKKTANIHWMGHQPLEILPNYIKAFDVCIIPYVPDDPFNISCSPLKLYEYLATGKPIVSTKLPSVDEYSGVVRIGCDYREFEREIRLALEENDGMPARRRELAYENSWAKRAGEIFSIVEEAGNQ